MQTKTPAGAGVGGRRFGNLSRLLAPAGNRADQSQAREQHRILCWLGYGSGDQKAAHFAAGVGCRMEVDVELAVEKLGCLEGGEQKRCGYKSAAGRETRRTGQIERHSGGLGEAGAVGSGGRAVKVRVVRGTGQIGEALR